VLPPASVNDWEFQLASPPLQPGEWGTLGLRAADGRRQLDKVLASCHCRVASQRDHTTHTAPERSGAGGQPGRVMCEPRVAIITGASKGIGAGLVAAYRKQSQEYQPRIPTAP
jgi:hypothetical protein